jgi:hypothetical protein
MKRITRKHWPILALAGLVGLVTTGAMSGDDKNTGSLEDTRAVLGKWIETQQIIANERNGWQQSREILGARIDLLRKEYYALQEKIEQTKTSLTEAEAKRRELQDEEREYQDATTLLTAAVVKLEADVERLLPSLPEPTQKRVQQLVQRIPDEESAKRVSIAERFQNVVGILNAANADNVELKVEYEVRNLSDGKPSEVRTLYVGLAQAYYVSANGEAGIGKPAADGWKWQPSKAISGDLLTALDIIQGKHTPAFVSLPASLQ